MPALPSQSTLISLPPDQQFQALDTLFEPSPDLHAIVGPMLSTQAFSAYPSLIDAIGDRLSTLSTASSPADQQVLIKILGSHPRLGRPAPNTSAESLSELSKKEQANLNTSGAEEQTERLRLMNEEYERQFPGLRFVYVDLSHTHTHTSLHD